MMQLRDYQKKAISNIKNQFMLGWKRVVLQLPTGGGKTVIFTTIALQTLSKNNSVLVITDRLELLDQSNRTFKAMGAEPEILNAETKKLTTGKMFIAMSETIKRRLKKSDYIAFIRSFTLIIIDEVHKQSFDKIYEFILPDQFVIGVTATPYRTGKMKPLSDFYSELVNGEQINELIATGYLSACESYGVPVDGLKSVPITAGDYNPAQMGKVYDDIILFDGVVENFKRINPNGKALLFAATVQNSIKMRDTLLIAGIKAEHLDADTPKPERARILNDFKSGLFQVLCNVGILTTGYDETSVDTIILYRATKSLPLFLQMCGRGSRIHEGKKQFYILDFGENLKRHGFWQQNRTWSLEITEQPKKKDAALVKFCPQCNKALSANIVQCDECGYVFKKKNKVVNPVIVQLQAMSYKDFIKTNWNIVDLENYRIAKGYKTGWLLRQLRSESDFYEYARLKGYARGWVYHKLKTINR